MRKAKPGRPRVDAPKNVTVGIKCAPGEKRRIERLAEARGMTPSRLGLELFRKEMGA